MDNRECCIRVDVARKRALYTRCLIFCFMTLFSVVIWLITGMGRFWPFYVAVTFLLTCFIESLQICSLPCIRKKFGFLTSEWEECEVQRCVNNSKNMDDCSYPSSCHTPCQPVCPSPKVVCNPTPSPKVVGNPAPPPSPVPQPVYQQPCGDACEELEEVFS